MYTALIIVSLCLVADCKIGIQQVNKDGRCPDVIGDEVGICAIECSSDVHCDDNMKCCRNGCGGFTCMQPVEERICHIPCPRMYDPVCGSDGQTYSNECMMNFTTCTRNQEFITKEYDGRCQELPTNPASNNGPCEMELMETQETPMIGAKIPQCDKDGYYKAKQCWGSIGMCWCADRYGNKINEPQRGKLTTEQCKILRANLQDSP